MPDLAQTTFITGAEDDLAVVDIYTESKTSGTVTSIQDYLDSFDKASIGKFLRGGKSVLSLLPALNKLSKFNVKSLDVRGLIGQLNNVSGPLANAVKNLPDGQMKTVLGEVAKGSETITATANGIVSKIPFSNLSSTQGIFNAVATLSPTAIGGVTNDPTITNAVIGLTKVANTNGVRGILEPILAGGKLTPQAVLKVAKETLPSLVKNSDLPSLIALSKKVGKGEISSIYNDVISDFTGNYTKPLSCTNQDALNEYSSVMSGFGDVDKYWNTLKFAGSNIPSIHSIAGASEDFKSVISLGAKLADENSDEKFNLLATTFKTTSIEESLKLHFSKTTITELMPATSIANSDLTKDTEAVTDSANWSQMELRNLLNALMAEQKTLLQNTDQNDPVSKAAADNQIDAIKAKIVQIQKKIKN